MNGFLGSPVGQFASDTLLTLLPATIAIWVAWTGVKTYQQKVQADAANEKWRQREQWLSNMRWAVEQTNAESPESQAFGWAYLDILVQEAARDHSAIAESGDDWLSDVAQIIEAYLGISDLNGIEFLEQEIAAKQRKLDRVKAKSDGLAEYPGGGDDEPH